MILQRFVTFIPDIALREPLSLSRKQKTRTMYIKQMYTGCLSEAAYYIESKGEAIIIDPLRETEPYTSLAEERGASIKYIFETHFHADFVSGHIDLAKKTGATIVYGPNAETGFDALIAKDGQVFNIGDVTIEVLHTPGHTMESSCFLLRDENGKQNGVFTGDTLFIGDVGRPDLAVKSDLTKEDLAGHLYESLHNKIMPLDNDVVVYPAHGAGSACGKNMSNETTDTIGNQKATNYALQDLTKADFIAQVTDGIAPPPQYFPKNAMLNKHGYDSVDEVISKGTIELSPAEVKQAQSEGALVLDTRSNVDFIAAHIPNALYIGLDGKFASWVGTVIENLQRPIVVVADPGKEEEAVLRLSRVGYDNTVGCLKGGMEAWKAAGFEQTTLTSKSATELKDTLENKTTQVLDVRRPTEYFDGHIPQANNAPLEYLEKESPSIDDNEPLYLHCLSGYRSVIAASILLRKGHKNLVNISDGYEGIQGAGISLERSEATV